MSQHPACGSAVSSELSRSTKWRVLGGALSGSTIEWFEYFLYASAAALVFDKQFFPSEDPVVSLMLSYLSLSLTFFIRPFGGIVFSHLGDRIGRKRTLVITLWLMGLATMGIGFLPNYAAIGVWAPILLVTCRIIQGLAISGEWGGAILLAYEYAPIRRRGFFGSVPQIGVALGMLLATLAMAGLSLLPSESFNAWGWRVPFIASVLLVMVGLWLRSGLDETPAFRKTQEEGRTAKLPIVDVVKYHWRAVVVAIGAKVVETAPFYIFATFILSYATGVLDFARTSVLVSVSVAALLAVFTIPLAGTLADRIGRRTVFTVAAVAMAAFAFPYFLLLHAGVMWALLLACSIAVGVLWPAITATYGTITSDMFAPEVRYTGITLGQQIGAAAAGGTAPLVATFLLGEFDQSWVPIALYLVLCSAISLISVRGAHPATSGLSTAPVTDGSGRTDAPV
ncbi:MFS transporter [Rhodococcus sp. NPDC057529]|uniref:MFS transporter n=1 Tax=Rhodococcus sp. NPDC057529 TaxID=3346158 RepID=UPI00366F1E74